VFLVALGLAVPAALLSWHAVERRCRWRAHRHEARPLASVGIPAGG
jgi:peptidoglycan/LPS O-acetylase OafA/YrhL